MSTNFTSDCFITFIWLLWILSLIQCCLARGIKDGDLDAMALNFYSRPDIHAPRLEVTTPNETLLSPGHIFLTTKALNLQTGPYIYDTAGELIWSGAGQAGIGRVMNFHPCTYDGHHRLCFFQGNDQGSVGEGYHTILDDRYQVVANVRTGNDVWHSDFHEFNVTPDGKSTLVTYVKPTPYDLAEYNNKTNGFGWLLESGFQRIDVVTGEVIFDWKASEHVDPSESIWPCQGVAGTSSKTSWDFIHINSIDINEEGDYLVSGRMTSTIYKISGKTGDIIWRLGGINTTNSTFDRDFDFAFQHHARFVQDSSESTIISFFDNHASAETDKHILRELHSSGMVVKINHKTLKASILRAQQLPSTLNVTASRSQGSVQLLGEHTTGNILVGWGSEPYITEHDISGNVLWNATIGSTFASTYRVFKGRWQGYPKDSPALWTYAHNSSSSIVFYTSWNGATEVSRWKFHVGHNSNTVSFVSDSVMRSGFETRYVSDILATSGHYSYVEALAGDGQILGRSSVQHLFIPGAELSEICNQMECPMSTIVTHDDIDDHAHHPEPSKIRTWSRVLHNAILYSTVEIPTWLLFTAPLLIYIIRRYRLLVRWTVL